MPHLPAESDPLLEATAKSLQLESLTAGPHTLRDEHRMREGVVRVSHLWWAAIAPSFHSRAVLCVAATERTEFRGRVFSPWLRGALTIGDVQPDKAAVCAVANIESDVLWPLLKCLDLTGVDPTITLDGIGYELHIDGAAQLSIRFSNPHTTQLREIEKALFATGLAVARITQRPDTASYVETWKGYVGG